MKPADIPSVVFASLPGSILLYVMTRDKLFPVQCCFPIPNKAGVDPGLFLKRGAPEAIIYKVLERGGPKSLKMAFECSFQLFSYKSFANIPPKGGGGGGGG